VGLRWRRVTATGLSMVPTLLPGDQLLIRRRGPVREGDLVVVRRPDRPFLMVVKRVQRISDGRWWLAGDNPVASDDSRVFGAVSAADLVGRVVWRYWPPVRWSRGRPGWPRR